MFLLNILLGDCDSIVDRFEVGVKLKLKEFVQFICGILYFLSGNQKIKVKFIRGLLLDLEICFDIIKLLFFYSCYIDFERAMNLVVNC